MQWFYVVTGNVSFERERKSINFLEYKISLKDNKDEKQLDMERDWVLSEPKFSHRYYKSIEKNKEIQSLFCII